MRKPVSQMCSVRKDVLRNCAKFTGKYLCQSLFLVYNFIKKETLTQVFSCQLYEICKNIICIYIHTQLKLSKFFGLIAGKKTILGIFVDLRCKHYIWNTNRKWIILSKNTHSEKSPSNETTTLSKSTNIDIWLVGTSDRIFIRGS